MDEKYEFHCKAFPPGTEVILWGDVDAKVIAMRVDGDGLDYLVAYWAGTSLHQEYVDGEIVSGNIRDLRALYFGPRYQD